MKAAGRLVLALCLRLAQVALVIGGHWPVVDVVFEYESHVRLLLLWPMGPNRDLST